MSFRIAELERVVPWLLRLPENQHFDVSLTNGKPEIEMQASGPEVGRLRAVFPGVIWAKKKDENIGWWDYRGETEDGILLHIYADYVGPNSCTRVEEVVTETIEVPACEAHTETRRVKKVRWICPDEAAS